LDAVGAAVDASVSAALGIGDLLDQIDVLVDLPRQLVIMMDALDEAANAQQRSLIATALAELARLSGSPLWSLPGRSVLGPLSAR
jgi:hypothetical protein